MTEGQIRSVRPDRKRVEAEGLANKPVLPIDALGLSAAKIRLKAR
jgi:hypothetical protein